MNQRQTQEENDGCSKLSRTYANEQNHHRLLELAETAELRDVPSSQLEQFLVSRWSLKIGALSCSAELCNPHQAFTAMLPLSPTVTPQSKDYTSPEMQNAAKPSHPLHWSLPTSLFVLDTASYANPPRRQCVRIRLRMLHMQAVLFSRLPHGLDKKC